MDYPPAADGSEPQLHAWTEQSLDTFLVPPPAADIFGFQAMALEECLRL
ncbi:MAG: hypothetical protein ACR2K1_13725 [Saprospiraceae bacterium]